MLFGNSEMNVPEGQMKIDVLVRMDPKDASVHVVGKIDPVGWQTFVGRDLYLAGSEQLRRIRNILGRR